MPAREAKNGSPGSIATLAENYQIIWLTFPKRPASPLSDPIHLANLLARLYGQPSHLPRHHYHPLRMENSRTLNKAGRAGVLVRMTSPAKTYRDPGVIKTSLLMSLATSGSTSR